ncbi:MAG: beta-carotene 15,15'-dioxygenase, Brp/Blh family [Bacteroidota bacterium]|nr:beta-carotene 15,15'-dioxygenase, Brp/Blh family [Bacteroidota bacterium]
MANKLYKVDYLFIGLGAANSLLLLNMFKKNLFAHKQIAIIEPQKKNVNDRTFCFWSDKYELEKLNLQHLVKYQWDEIRVGKNLETISPLSYLHIRGIDVYNEVKSVLPQINHTYFETSFDGKLEVIDNSFQLTLDNTSIIAKKVFDSSLTKYQAPQKNESHLYQSFYGLEVEIIAGEIDNKAVTMMDFDIPQNNSCQFLYVLPFSKNHALFEVTCFGSEPITQAQAELILKEQLQKKGLSYRVIESEKGIIPMSSASLTHKQIHPNWIFTGAKANLIKPTTGYAFHAMAIHANELSQSIAQNQPLAEKPKAKRFAFYDRLLLKILELKPEKGKVIFTQLFTAIETKRVLSFLNERTTMAQELKIFCRLPILLFLQFALKDIAFLARKIAPVSIASIATCLAILLQALHFEILSWGILALGFLFIGLTHGALDHLTSKKPASKYFLLPFIIKYLSKAAGIGVLWYLIPDFALLLFIFYSAWHFGQADFKEWGLVGSTQTFLWGFTILMVMLTGHFEETKMILKHISLLKTNEVLAEVSASGLWIIKTAFIGIGSAYIYLYKSKQMALTLSYLLLASFLPLLITFGIYFIFQHSLHGWSHLKQELHIKPKILWLQSLPFSLGGAIIIALFTSYYQEIYLGIFFILLSCLSIPHIISMHRFYGKQSF